MDPRTVGELVANCMVFGGVVWVAVVGVASAAGIAILVESVVAEPAPRSSRRPGERPAAATGDG